MSIGPQEVLDGSALFAGAEALILVDLPPVGRLIAYVLVAASIVSHILKTDHGAPLPNTTEWKTPEDSMREN